MGLDYVTCISGLALKNLRCALRQASRYYSGVCRIGVVD
ncbi:hypothetical protein AVDCRST_MAG94-6299 [uncultured Leptolyngbya sp.]|uniref:Uncharacterized protein n=1 Tax=uncultured Leptolyngbya sp. TaxID=332963 RepID=A0A6J4PFM6_9CYAN|nr:hypothetical protein AVDCRST_MAG94-6299 [uncultured Leptolyngbya sp.]